MKAFVLIVAIIAFASLSGVSQTGAAEHFAKAKQLREAGNFEAALAEIGKAIAIQPNNSRFYLERATVYRSNGNEGLFFADLKSIFDLDPNQKDKSAVWLLLDYNNEGWAGCHLGLAKMNAFIAKNPRDDKAYYMRFRLHECLRQFPAALDDISMAIKLKPDNTTAQSSRAALLSIMGSHDLAMKQFAETIKFMEAKYRRVTAKERLPYGRLIANVYRGRSLAYDRLKKYPAAIADHTRVIELEPSAGNYYFRAHLHTKTGAHEKAISDLTQAIAFDSKWWHYYYQRAQAHEAAGKYEEAIDDYRQCLRMGAKDNGMFRNPINRLTKLIPKASGNAAN